jgi:ADP-ribose pyrophosphatase YjhB (NUDIX family)
LDDDGRVPRGQGGIEPARGRWNIPGGFCEPAERPEDCAILELKEETGCDNEVMRLLGHAIARYSQGSDHALNAIYVARTELPPTGSLAFPSTRIALDLAFAD